MNGIKSTGKGKSGKSYGAKRVKRTSKEVISETLLSILNTPEERLLLPWMSYMLLKDKEDHSMDSVNKYILIN